MDCHRRGAQHRRDEGGTASETAYDKATRALQLALERANQAAARIMQGWAAGVIPDERDIAHYRRLSAALRYAEAVWQVEADLLVAAGERELRRRSAVPSAPARLGAP
ncbi:hypothetical protein GCM10022237_22130 [Nocardioides ginsengisoli]|uniref:Uncharacterized protein n=1 Tax=Nocardioides ginsengisoli TaxID=363868 RepID=A0ABW3W971_9ACTN